MGDGLDLSRGRYSRRRRRRRLAALAVVVLLGAAVWGLRARLGPVWAVLARIPEQADILLAEHFVPGYTRRMEELRSRNRELHTELAATAGLEAENEALRALLESPAAPQSTGWQPVRMVARSLDGSITLAGQLAPGTPVLDEEGRLAGVVSGNNPTGSTVDPVGRGTGEAAALAGDCCGVVQRRGSGLVLTALPRHSDLKPGTVAATADGVWVGTLAEAPSTDATGLTEQAPLQDTGSTAGSVFFVPGG